MMPVLITCGGKGTRLAPLTDHGPKYLVEVCGRPFAEWQLELLRAQGYTEIILCTGHFHEQIEAALGNGSAHGLWIRYSRETEPLGVDGAIRQALGLIGDRPFFSLYGDSYLECDYRAIEARCHRTDLDAVLTVTAGVDYGLRAFNRYPPRHAEFVSMPAFQEMGSFAGLECLRRHLSR